METTHNWQQYEQLRLERLQQQRQRMTNMKDVIEQYVTIIKQLQSKLTQIQLQKDHFESKYLEMLNYNHQLTQQQGREGLLYTPERQQHEKLLIAYQNLKQSYYEIERQNSWLKHSLQKYKEPGKIRTQTKIRVNSSYSPQKMTMMQEQLQKQQLLICKYQSTEHQLQELIRTLKHRCPCRSKR